MSQIKISGLCAAVVLCFGSHSFAADQNLNTDLIVVGAGSAGLSAAVQGAELGKKVILLEKNPYVGGNSQHAEGLFAVDSEWNRLRGDPLTRQEAYRQFIERQNHLVDPYKNKDFVEGAAENIEWLSKHGIEFEVIRETPLKDNTWHIIKNYKGVNHGAGLIKGMKDAADKLGVQTMLATPAVDLIKKDDKVVGVIAKDKKGNTYHISGKAVILASGSFGDDPKKVAEWGHRDPEAWKSSVPINKTGDGIVMAMKAGAERGPVSFIGHLGTEGKGIKFLSNLYGTSWQPFNLWVNRDGLRFTDESQCNAFSEAANAIYAQPGHYGWCIFDENTVKYLMEKGASSGIGVLVPIGTKYANLQKDIDEALAADSDGFKSASTVAGLAKAINVPAAVLEKTVAEYNKNCELQSDPMFLKDRRYLVPIEGKKLYALKLKSYFFSAYGGLITNRDHQVLDKDSRPIKGLYAAGLEVSNMVGPTYPDFFSGHAFGFASYSGRYAAINAVKEMK